MKNVPNIKIYKYNNIPKNTIKGLFKFLCKEFICTKYQLKSWPCVRRKRKKTYSGSGFRDRGLAQPWCERRFPFVCLHSLCLFVLFLWKSIPGAENWIHTCSSPLTFNLIFEQLAVQLRFNYSRDISEQSVKMVIYIYMYFFFFLASQTVRWWAVGRHKSDRACANLPFQRRVWKWLWCKSRRVQRPDVFRPRRRNKQERVEDWSSLTDRCAPGAAVMSPSEIKSETAGWTQYRQQPGILKYMSARSALRASSLLCRYWCPLMQHVRRNLFVFLYYIMKRFSQQSVK